MFLVPPAWPLETGFPSDVGILELRDTLVPIISGTFIDVVCSSLPHHGPRKTVSVLGCYTNTYCLVDVPYGSGYGSRVGDKVHRPGLQGPKGVSTPLHHRLIL